MKFYRDFKSIFKNNIYLVIGFGAVLPTVIHYLIKPYFQITDGSGFGNLVILSFCIMWLVALYALCKILLNLKNRRKAIFEFSDSGIRYPYLLKNDMWISWQDIKDIQYKANDSDRRLYFNHLLIELTDSLDVGRFNRVYGLATLKSLRNRYKKNSLMIFKDIVRGHELKDVADLLISQWKKSTNQAYSVVEDQPVCYNKSGATWRSFLLSSVVFIGIGAFMLNVLYVDEILQEWQSVSDFRDFSAKFYIFLIPLCIVVVVIPYVICRYFICTLITGFKTKVAVTFNHQGIYILNDKIYTPYLVWSNVADIRIEQKQYRRTLMYKPFLVIALNVSTQYPKKLFYIPNNLVDTSIYELCDVLNDYRQFNGSTQFQDGRL